MYVRYRVLKLEFQAVFGKKMKHPRLVTSDMVSSPRGRGRGQLRKGRIHITHIEHNVRLRLK